MGRDYCIYAGACRAWGAAYCEALAARVPRTLVCPRKKREACTDCGNDFEGCVLGEQCRHQLTTRKRELGVETQIQLHARKRPRMVETTACTRAGGFSGQIQLARRTAGILLVAQSFAHERFQRDVRIVVLISKVASLVDHRPPLVIAGRISPPNGLAQRTGRVCGAVWEIHGLVRSAHKMIKTIAFGKASVDGGVSQHANTTSRVHQAPSIAHGRSQNSVSIVVQDSKVALWQDSAAHLVSQLSIRAKNRMAIGAVSQTQFRVMKFLMLAEAIAWPRVVFSQRLQPHAMLRNQRDCFAQCQKRSVAKIVEKGSKVACLEATVSVDSNRHTSACRTQSKASGVVWRTQRSAQIARIRAYGIGAFTRGSVSRTEHHGVVAKSNMSQARLYAPEKNRLKLPDAKKISKDVSFWASAKRDSKMLGSVEKVEGHGRDPRIHQHVQKLQLMASRIVCSRVNSILE